MIATPWVTSQLLFNGAVNGALIARVGNSAPFPIGPTTRRSSAGRATGSEPSDGHRHMTSAPASRRRSARGRQVPDNGLHERCNARARGVSKTHHIPRRRRGATPGGTAWKGSDSASSARTTT